MDRSSPDFEHAALIGRELERVIAGTELTAHLKGGGSVRGYARQRVANNVLSLQSTDEWQVKFTSEIHVSQIGVLTIRKDG